MTTAYADAPPLTTDRATIHRYLETLFGTADAGYLSLPSPG